MFGSKSENGGADVIVHFIRLPFVFEDNEDSLKNLLEKVIADIIGLTV